MPEFIINDDKPLRGLSDFERGYIDAMFFTNGDTGDDERPWLLNELGTRRLTRKALVRIKADCGAFLAAFVSPGRTVAEVIAAQENYDEEQAGRDFWYTRQGHGVGFWCRDELAEAVGDALSRAAKAQGEAYVETWRGWIYYR
jgi:hypothetical protein